MEQHSSKLLTISVAAYNGEATLRKALDSCLVKNADRLEVIVVDDGSSDHTAQITEEYRQQYPDLFRLIRQPNGGYGSTIEASLQAARGRYFRTLDCDDWLETASLSTLLDFLADCDADVVFTNYRTVQGRHTVREFRVNLGRSSEQLYTFDTLGPGRLDLEIHALNCRTGVLRQADIRLPHHCSYTDMAYTFLAMTAAQTIRFCPVMLYNYRLGRDGQSVSIDSYRKHFDEYATVTRQVLAVAETLPDDARGRLLRGRARDIAQYGIELLLRFPAGEQVRRQLADYDGMLRRDYPSIAASMTNKNTRLLRATRYLGPSYRRANWDAGRKIKSYPGRQP